MRVANRAGETALGHWLPMLLALATLMLCSGCATFDGFPKRTPDPARDLELLQPVVAADQVAACLATPSVACRDRIVGARIYVTDIQFSKFEEEIFLQTRTAGFSATLATLGLTTAAAVASGGASQVLSGISAFIIGGREAFQKEVLAEKTILAIHTAMRARRAEVLLRLRTGLAQPLSVYPFTIALSDLNDYYNAGTVLGALIGITETVGVRAEKAELALREHFSFTPDAWQIKLRAAVCANADCSSLNQAAIDRAKACWPDALKQSLKDSNSQWTDFMLQPSLVQYRAVVVGCMGL